MMENINQYTIITAIICLSVIELVAMYLGYNGTIRMIIVAAIATMVGVKIPTPKILGGIENGTRRAETRRKERRE